MLQVWIFLALFKSADGSCRRQPLLIDHYVLALTSKQLSLKKSLWNAFYSHHWLRSLVIRFQVIKWAFRFVWLEISITLWSATSNPVIEDEKMCLDRRDNSCLSSLRLYFNRESSTFEQDFWEKLEETQVTQRVKSIFFAFIVYSSWESHNFSDWTKLNILTCLVWLRVLWFFYKLSNYVDSARKSFEEQRIDGWYKQFLFHLWIHFTFL